MKTGLMPEGAHAAPIVALLDASTGHSQAEVARARAFAEPLLAAETLDTGENALTHADGVVAILQGIGAAQELQAAAYLVYAADFLAKPEEIVAKAFGDSHASLVTHTRKLVQMQRAARRAQVSTDQRAEQTERVRKMLLAFSRDLRVVLLRLASRLQTLRWHAASKQPCPAELAAESQAVFAPLANRLGIWQIKWELEDLAFRFREPEAYKALAKGLQEKRVEREQRIEAARAALQSDLLAQGIVAEVQGRPKHLYSIHKKMQGKHLSLDRVFDLRALRVIVASVADCYAVLARLHEVYTPVPGEFDDYIAKPKPNGYQSLHTVVLGADGRAMEVQIRTREMHDHAEHGVAAHWAYKEAGARGYAGVSAAGEFEEQVARARKAVLNQLLAWERDAVQGEGGAVFDDRIYVFTPQATIVELTAGATPVDFAYAVHTDLGHRCRGARIDGQMLPLNTALHSGQTVEIIAIKEGGPSLDWLNPELGYLQSQRSRAKVRAWFNALQQAQTIAKGRELVEKLLQREGKTALKLDELAARLGFKGADALFEVVGKDEYSLRNIELLLRPPEPVADEDELLAQRHTRSASSPGGGRGGVLVVGIDSLLTTLSRCCRPAPPDAISGFVTRGKGVAIHRSDCSNLAEMRRRSPERVIAVAWAGGDAAGKSAPVYPVDVLVEAGDRQGLLRDVLEVFAKEKMNVVAVNTQSLQGSAAAKPRTGGGDTAWMSFTLELSDATRLAKVLRDLCAISGVRSARRK
ncbi:bifunctional (p)ppGpp synthetase/guanosine-3',5'-bis(diphosphate) 3'-pyrophosphohydrolase [Pelomonas sp. UHG3]|uniref:Bifunctional (P)ppGpp synthetase/guanosine-3',5'-bis(Diphosphate) 3'-pyrophosphohydrolase n=1 Tax=Roseateles hydrophilus TaxID=2975054 RepID=A0ACC6C6Q5_9BURK|nr:bifunctional (p)ppGpp synthetase/guanosine-3',5'-bis(diphosphate) 3'-pyrophosphohydrolase [Pelomonas sp. UHG3]MCY4744004.1 bifunctional (p)ppGpp synthetase/guanosine-3',5'-bis(diphosphate) 3'-pyrophosphohydrolase [Pelomonas sp. UHG3]